MKFFFFISMVILKVISCVILGLALLAFLLISLAKLLTHLADQGAKKRGKKYCEERGYIFKKVEPFPNHYGLYFTKDKMHFYASFHYENDKSFTWIKGSPEEKIEKRLKRKQNKKFK